MEKIKQFNIRVYGLIQNENEEILVLHEPFGGKLINKFPGGGLEFGEGTKECLIRECREELGLEIDNIQHFYTQEDFVASGLKPEDHLMMIYYTAQVASGATANIVDTDIESIHWYAKNELTPDMFYLPMDKTVVELYLNA